MKISTSIYIAVHLALGSCKPHVPITASRESNEIVSRDPTSVAFEVIPTSLAPQESDKDFSLEKRTMTWDQIVLTNACVCI